MFGDGENRNIEEQAERRVWPVSFEAIETKINHFKINQRFFLQMSKKSSIFARSLRAADRKDKISKSRDIYVVYIGCGRIRYTLDEDREWVG